MTDNKIQNMIYNFTHDLKGPLTGIQGNLELLLNKLEGEKEKKYADSALRSSKKLSAQIEMFLDIFKYPSGKKILNISSINMKEFFSEVQDKVSTLLNRKNLSINMESTVEVITCDREILLNIIFSFIESSITFSLMDSVIDLKCINSGPTGFTLEVSDDGKAYPEDQNELKMLFDLFDQDQVRNLGLRTGKGYSFPYIKVVTDVLKGNIKFSNSSRTKASVHFGMKND